MQLNSTHPEQSRVNSNEFRSPPGLFTELLGTLIGEMLPIRVAPEEPEQLLRHASPEHLLRREKWEDIILQ